MGKSEVEFCQIQELAGSLVLRYFERIFHHCFLHRRGFFCPRYRSSYPASEGGANYIGDRERCSRPTMEIALPSPPPPCPSASFLASLLATNDPSLLPPRRRQTFSRQTAVVARCPTARQPPGRENPFSRPSLHCLARRFLDRLPHLPNCKKNRASDKNPESERNSFPFEIVGYVNRRGGGGRGNGGEDLDPFTPPLSQIRRNLDGYGARTKHPKLSSPIPSSPITE